MTIERNVPSFSDIFTQEAQKAYDDNRDFLTMLARVEGDCNQYVSNMHLKCRIVSPEHLAVDYIGNSGGVLAQGKLDIAMHRQQDGGMVFTLPGDETEFETAGQSPEDVLTFILQGIARREALNGAYKIVCAQFD